MQTAEDNAAAGDRRLSEKLSPEWKSSVDNGEGLHSKIKVTDRILR